jgi:hypothetical protein
MPDGDWASRFQGWEKMDTCLRHAGMTHKIIVFNPKECSWHDPAIATKSDSRFCGMVGEAISRYSKVSRKGYIKKIWKEIACLAGRQE